MTRCPLARTSSFVQLVIFNAFVANFGSVQSASFTKGVLTELIFTFSVFANFEISFTFVTDKGSLRKAN